MEQAMKLCVPCAEKMKSGYTVTAYGGTGKITCALCNRRRYGREHKVEVKPKKKE